MIIVDAYVAANANFIVTNDRHYNILKEVVFPTVRCVRLEDFVL
jgi:hypothetical protein